MSAFGQKRTFTRAEMRTGQELSLFTKAGYVLQAPNQQLRPALCHASSDSHLQTGIKGPFYALPIARARQDFVAHGIP